MSGIQGLWTRVVVFQEEAKMEDQGVQNWCRGQAEAEWDCEWTSRTGALSARDRIYFEPESRAKASSFIMLTQS